MCPWMWWWCMVLLLVGRAGEVRAQTGDPVVFPLGSFQKVSVSGNVTVAAVVRDVPEAVAFVTLQVHAQRLSTALSFTRVPGPAPSGPDRGLLAALAPGQTSLSVFLSTPDRGPVEGTGVSLPYGRADPVPGGCGDGAPGLGADPNLYLTFNLYETTLRFAPAGVGYARGATPPPCNVSTETAVRRRLLYDVYRYLLPAGDQSEASLFSGLQEAASAPSPGGANASLGGANASLGGANASLGGANASRGGAIDVSLVTTLSWEEDTVAVVSSAPGRGAVYAVVVRDPGRDGSASYVPAHTYACSPHAALDGCLTLGRISTKVFFTFAGLVGLFVCFFGHRFFKCELFCMGFALTCFLFFALITRTTTLDYDLRLALAAVLGAVGGALLVTSWWRCGSVMACVAVVGLILGFVVAATVFFTPFGELHVFQSSALVFWVTFCCLVLSVALLLVRWPREGNILTCAVVGAYCVVLAVNVYASTSLSYITLNVLKRFLNSDFDAAYSDVAFRDVDFVLMTLWAALGAAGAGLQLYRERARPFFPPSPYLLWQQERERRRTNVLDPSHHGPAPAGRLLARLRQLTRRRQAHGGEHTPLLL